MSHMAGELIVIERHPKEGTALLVENAVQDVIDDSSIVDGRFAALRGDLPWNPDTVEGAFYNAEKMRQAVFSTITFLAGKTALRNMTAHVREHGRLAIADTVPFDPHEYAEYGSQTVQSYRTLRAAHHLVTAAQAEMEAHKDPAHPYHALHKHLADVTKEHKATWTEWHKGPGANRWPYYYDSKRSDGEGVLLGALCLNLQLGVSLSAAKAVHHLIHQNRNADAAELDAAAAEALPRTLWLSSSDRHLGWRPDWQEHAAKGGHLGNMPMDGVLALLQPSRSDIVSANGYAASKSGMAIMQNPDFCPHKALQDGPIAKAGSCAADPWVRYPMAADRDNTQDFFGEMGYTTRGGEFNFVAVMLAMGRRLVAEEVLPALTPHP